MACECESLEVLLPVCKQGKRSFSTTCFSTSYLYSYRFCHLVPGKKTCLSLRDTFWWLHNLNPSPSLQLFETSCIHSEDDCVHVSISAWNCQLELLGNCTENLRLNPSQQETCFGKSKIYLCFASKWETHRHRTALHYSNLAMSLLLDLAPLILTVNLRLIAESWMELLPFKPIGIN